MGLHGILEYYVILFELFLLIIASISNEIITKPECPESCGSVLIPYPFGTSPGCYYNESFLISCNHTKPYFPNSNVSILNISVPDGEIRVESFVSRACIDNLGNLTTNVEDSRLSTITNSSFPLSLRNKFTTVGCNNAGLVGGYRGRYFGTGCVALCNATSDTINGDCSGVGCCETKISQDVFDFQTVIQFFENKFSWVNAINPCSFAFVAEEGAYNFSSSDHKNLSNRESFPVVLDWAVGDNLSCKQASTNLTIYACVASNSECLNSTYGSGYRCKCSGGFQGNPYLPKGCTDVNECDTSQSQCNTTCVNLIGSYTCTPCPKGFGGDGFNNGTGCFPSNGHTNSIKTLSVALGLCIGLLVMLLGGSWVYWGLRKRKLMKLREKFFQQNGGLLLQQQHSFHGTAPSDTARVFRADELSKATNNYHESRVLGQGGYGTVYKGVLNDNKVVAIKKSKICDQSQIEQFINEVIVLSQINHRNVVKLLGCCLETEVPLLVYEFITNGTVSEHIHGDGTNGKYASLPWQMRLKIAMETAGAIAYLHSSASMPVIHRDIKTANILLDENFTAKVSDFGASRLVPLDQTQLTTLVQGTLGYLDPEYLLSSQLTEKSDVYSFGVVLAELLTSQKALSFSRSEYERNLAMCFASSMKEERIIQILDQNLVSEENVEQIKVVVNIAKSCLRLRGEDRPTMKEVASELEGLNKQKLTRPWSNSDHHDFITKETECLIRRPTMEVASELEGLNKQNLTRPWSKSDHHDFITKETECLIRTSDQNGGTSSITGSPVFDSMSIQYFDVNLKPYADGR